MSIRLSTRVFPVSRVSSSARSSLSRCSRSAIRSSSAARSADGRRGPGPVVERRPARRWTASLRVGVGRLVDHGGDAAVRRVDDLAGPAVGRVTPLPSDVEIGFTVHMSPRVADLRVAAASVHRFGTLPTRGTPRCGVRKERVRRRCDRRATTSRAGCARRRRSPAR